MAPPLSAPPVDFNPLTDPRCQHGAYINLGITLYDVMRWEAQSPISGKLHVVNSLTDHPLWLTGTEVQRATLVRAAPPIEIPVDWSPALMVGPDLPSENAD